MPCSRTLVRNPLRFLLLAVSARAADPVRFDLATLELGKARITVTSPSSKADFTAALDELSREGNWRVELDGKNLEVRKAYLNLRLQSIQLELPGYSLPFEELADIPGGKLTVTFTPLSSRLTIATGGSAPKAKPAASLLARCFGYSFTSDKKKADIDITGGWQAGVGAKPEYFWSVKAGCPMPLGDGAKYGQLGPSFTAEASQQQNADPDSMKAGITYRRDIAPPKTRNGWQITADALSYEFERNIKKEPVLNDPVLNDPGKPVLRPFLSKNSNLMWTGMMRYVNASPALNWTLGFAGFEAGRSVTRTVKKTSQESEQQPVTRLHFDVNLYRTFFHNGQAFLAFHGYQDLRLPFYREPYKEAGFNGGGMYLTGKPRYWSLVELTWLLNKGIGINMQYKRGSLPPSFEFVDHQITLGFNIQLKRK